MLSNRIQTYQCMMATFVVDGAYPPFLYDGAPAMAQAVGTFDGATVRLEVSPDGVNWSPIDEATYTANGATPMFMPSTTMRWTCSGAGPGTNVKAYLT